MLKKNQFFYLNYIMGIAFTIPMIQLLDDNNLTEDQYNYKINIMELGYYHHYLKNKNKSKLP